MLSPEDSSSNGIELCQVFYSHIQKGVIMTPSWLHIILGSIHPCYLHFPSPLSAHTLNISYLCPPPSFLNAPLPYSYLVLLSFHLFLSAGFYIVKINISTARYVREEDWGRRAKARVRVYFRPECKNEGERRYIL